VRDMLAARVPTQVVCMDLCDGGLAGSGIVVISHKLGPPPDLLAIAGDAARFLLWMMSTRRSWNLASPLQEIG
jgi:hypothetical protein